MHYKLSTSVITMLCVVGVLTMVGNARADGDPEEVIESNTEFYDNFTDANEGELLPDEQGLLSEDAVATVTADGDFLLPTYLLPGETASVERTTTVETMLEPTVVETQPVVIRTPVQPGQETVVRTRTTTTTTLLGNQKMEESAEETATKETTELPFVSATTNTETEKQTPIYLGEGYQKANTSAGADQAQVLDRAAVVLEQPGSGSVMVAPLNNRTQTSGSIRGQMAEVEEPAGVKVHSAGGKLLIPLAAVPTGETVEAETPKRDRVIIPSEYADQMSERLRMGVNPSFHMPHEIRITFYPRASAFSGQTLKWVRTFALAAIQDPRLVIEVRASCAEAELQDRRLSLVKGVLQGVGLSTHQILVNYTDRPVDTMLLRAIPRPEPAETVVAQKEPKLPKNISKVKKW